MPKIIIKKDECIGCGACISVCPQEVFVLKEGVSCVKNPDNCIGCKACEHACPIGIISVINE